MSDPVKKRHRALANPSRRQLLGWAGVIGGGTLVAPRAALGAPQRTGVTTAVDAALRGQNVYKAIGVTPFINCRGTLTVLGGNIELPEVRQAKTLANQQHAQLDEVAAAVGARLAALTGAEWGMVSSGCAAAMSHATAACVAGGNPDLHVRIPDLAGFEKDEVIIPGHSRNVYDAAIRAIGVKVVEVETPDELERAIGPRTAMIYIFANNRNESGPMDTPSISAIARRHNVPVLVDAAAEILTVPNIHLERGATLVCYSGGKFIRGPQSAGLLLGRKDLVEAAWVHAAPHHGYGRSMKVGREEMVAMLVAVESWVRRDHEAEWATWVARCQHIADRVSTIPGVTAIVRSEPGGRSNRSPSVAVRWTASQIGLTGQELTEILNTTEPRIMLGGGGGGGPQGPSLPGDTGVSMVPSTMAPGDERVVANRLRQVLSARHTLKPVPPPAPPAGDVSGVWDVEIQYVASRTTHGLQLFQNSGRLSGVHQGNFQSRDINGTVAGDVVTLQSVVTERHGDSLNYRFSGRVAGDTMSGTLDMGEYLSATWTAKRRIVGRQG